MIDPKHLPMEGTIKFTYNAPIFEGDPDDKYELARLEQGEYSASVREALDDLFGPTYTFELSILPE